jgi:hypothetical protein
MRRSNGLRATFWIDFWATEGWRSGPLCLALRLNFVGKSHLFTRPGEHSQEGLCAGSAAISSAASGYGGPYNFGTPATEADIAMLDIDAMPDGRELPAGSGNYETGKEVYTAKCMGYQGAEDSRISQLN